MADDELTELAERLRAATIAHGAPAGKLVSIRSRHHQDPLIVFGIGFAVFRLFGDYAHGIGNFLEVRPNTARS